MEGLLSDVRLAVRGLVKRPVFAVVVIVTLGLGIGANVAIFSVIEGVLLRPLPYRSPDGLAMLWNEAGPGFTTWLSTLDVLDYRERVEAFDGIAAYTDLEVNLTGGPGPERVRTTAVSPNLFPLVGVGAVRGRTFTESEGATEGSAVVLLSEGLFRQRFGGDETVLGRPILVNGVERTVVGIVPGSFRLPVEFAGRQVTQLYIPLVMDPANPGPRGSRSLNAFARLREGATLAQARAEVRTTGEQWITDGVLQPGSSLPGAVPMKEFVLGDIRPALLVLVGAVGLVLLIACANVASLTMARGEDRRREVAVRLALGAGRSRLIRTLLTESTVLALFGGGFGLLLAFLGVRLLGALDPASIPRVEGVRLDASAIAFTLIVSIATGLLFGAAPAWRFSRPDLGGTLREGGRSEGSSRRGVRFRGALVVAQIALAVVLVIGSGLLIRSFAGLRAIEPGFRMDHILTAQVALPAATYPANTDVVDFYGGLIERLRELPGVASAGAARVLPLSRTIGDWSITVEGRDNAPGENPNGDWQVVVPGYFETMGLRLLGGRFLTTEDRMDALPVVVINRTMAAAYWPAGEALGRRFRIGDTTTPWFTIVGIVEDVKRNALTEAPRNEMYHPHSQFGLASGGSPRRMTLVVRTSGDPLALAGPLRQVVREMNPDLPVSEVRTMESVMGDAVSGTRFTALLLTLFAVLALVLAAVGVYGVVSHGVNRRTREFGIRIALGARAGQVVRLAVADSVPLVLAGIGAGLLLALGATRVLSTLLYGVGALDPVTFIAVPLALGAIALIASFIPARRASGTDPLTALRAE